MDEKDYIRIFAHMGFEGIEFDDDDDEDYDDEDIEFDDD